MNQTGSSVFFFFFLKHLTDTLITSCALDNITNYILAFILLSLKSYVTVLTHKALSS